jgi:hypothetical protein
LAGRNHRKKRGSFVDQKGEYFLRQPLDKARKLGKLGGKEKAFRAFSRVFRLLFIFIRGIALFEKLHLKGGFDRA